MSHQDKRNHKVKSDYGKNDYYKHYSNTVENPVSKELWDNVLMDYLNSINEMISQKGYVFRIPCRLGTIELRKIKKEVKLDQNGNVINTFNVNWKETKKLWLENPKAKEKGIKIRYVNKHSDGYSFRIVYIKKSATFKNKSVYKMLINREMRRSTEKPIMNKELDAFLLNNNI